MPPTLRHPFFPALLASLALALGPPPATAAPNAPLAPLAPALPLARDPAAARLAIARLLDEMSAAITAADQPAYLRLVDHSDPIFSTEQKAWALDLGRARPDACAVRLAAGDEPQVHGDGSVVATVEWAWTMPGGRPRTLKFPARFVRAAASNGAPALPYLYAGEVWKTLEAPGLRVRFAPGGEAAAKIVADALPEVRAHVHAVFELENDRDLTERTQEVKIYRSMRHLQHSIYLSYTDGLSGWNEPGESIKLLVVRNPDQGLRGLIAHEYGHVASFQLGPKANDMPWWILEGVAEHAAEKFQRNGNRVRTIVRRWAENGGLVAWEKLADFRGEARNHQANVYAQGHHMIDYITERFGKTKRTAWMRAMAAPEPRTMDEATREVLGLPFADLDSQWRQSIQDRAPADPPPSPSPPQPLPARPDPRRRKQPGCHCSRRLRRAAVPTPHPAPPRPKPASTSTRHGPLQ